MATDYKEKSLNVQSANQHEFKYRVVKTDFSENMQKAEVNTLTHNAIFFQLEGQIQISWDDYNEVIVNPGELYFLPRGANISACIIGEEIKYIAARLDHDINSKSVFNELLRAEEKSGDASYSFLSMPIKEPLKLFVDSIKHYVIDGVDNQQIHNMKFKELYFIFRNYYTKRECVNLFYPILKDNSKFKAFILDNYQISTSIEELVAKSNMSRSTFDRNFKENFGMTPLKWIDVQTRILIMRKAAEPNVTVKDIMYEVGVYNPSQFTQLCKRLCGVAPSQLIKG